MKIGLDFLRKKYFSYIWICISFVSRQSCNLVLSWNCLQMRPLSIGGPSLPNWPFLGAPPVFWLVGPRACPKLNSRGTSKEKPMIRWRKLAIGIETAASIWMNRRLCMDHTSWLPPMTQFWRSITSGVITTIHFSDVMPPINSEWLHITSRYGKSELDCEISRGITDWTIWRKLSFATEAFTFWGSTGWPYYIFLIFNKIHIF